MKGYGIRGAVVIETRFESAVTEANGDTCVGSFIEDVKTVIEFDLRKRDWRKIGKTDSEIRWCKKTYTVDVHEFSTFHCPIIYRFVTGRGYFVNADGIREYFTPEPAEVSTRQHMSKSIIRMACFLVVVCGVTLRNAALIFSVLFKVPVTKSSIKRWIDEIGSRLSEDDILKKLTDLKTPSECHIDGYWPLGADRCVMVIKDDCDRILITYEADSENGVEAKNFLRKLKDSGVNVVTAFSDYSGSFTSAIKEVFPEAKFQADHFHTAKNIWKHLKKALLGYRKEIKKAGENEKNAELTCIATELWKLRWTLLKKPSNLSEEEKVRIAELEEKDAGFVKNFRSFVGQIASIFDRSNTEKQAKIKLEHLKRLAENTESGHLKKICRFFEEHWDQAMRYLKKKGFAKYKRSSNSESGMRILRRLEKNHDGIRSEVTRKNYIKIYQVLKYMHEDITDFLDPQPDTQ